MIRDAAEADIPELVRLRGLLFDALGEEWGAARGVLSRKRGPVDGRP